ncbi:MULTISPECIES: DUF2490 domain-containing protein [unclassified Sphingomonas]|uniref:DUF2490 domain-containing protein n=1 Tax=unclassified Sphingomonas TaxID=196159 RepID=UPI000700900E|nr:MULTISPECIES: DUF2490 domain-containing protein [unclassified Sphingomonas]KQX25443.1 hypothetical protein ASD17_21870 [Sphingomonas sp. Root1294]KQY66435.1 hypothetical protein ASD39_11675 [Sphingomonas sp. Root50]KRB90248.1 hypothetical protein ASE22_15275 [Sphingomonas sp. Root720]
MKTISRRAAIGLSILLATAAPTAWNGARAQTVQDEQLWVNLTLQGHSGRLVHFIELQPRFGSGAGRLDHGLFRPAIGMALRPGLSLYQGYAHVFTPRDGTRDLHEHRSFQQLSWVMGRPWNGELASRTRFEQRWRNDGRDMGLRLREMLRLEIPVARSGLAALGYAEMFVALNDTDWGARGGFDQLRSFAGAEIPLAGASTIELGYLNQYINQPSGRRRVNHVLSASLFVRR